MAAQTTSASPTGGQSLGLQEEEKIQPLSMPLSTPQDSKKDPDEVPEQKTAEERQGYITGFNLAIVMVSVTLVTFLMLLDMSIIVTVSTTPLRIIYAQEPVFVHG